MLINEWFAGTLYLIPFVLGIEKAYRRIFVNPILGNVYDGNLRHENNIGKRGI
jgi:hypothetical protein